MSLLGWSCAWVRRVYLGGRMVVIIVVCGVYGMVYKGMRISV